MKAGYKQTEVGVIPTDWELKNMGEICSYQNGTALEEYFGGSDGFYVISIGNYSPLGKFVYTGNYICFEKGKFLKKFLLNKNDLAILLNDKTAVGTIIGRAILIDEDNKYIFNQRTMRLTSRGFVNPNYLYFQINSIKTHRRIVDAAKPGTQIYVNTNDIVDLLIPYPPTLTEQTTIATALSDADALIESLEQLIHKKRNIKQGAMQELLTGKKRLPGFSGEWEVKRLGELLDYEQPTKYLVSNSEYSDGNDVPVLTAGKTFILGYTDEQDGIFNDLPVIIFDDFTTASKYVTFPFKAKSSAMKMLKPKDKNTSLKLIFEIIQSIKFQLGDHKRYWISEYQSLEIKFPSDKEQTVIAEILSDMDAELAELEKKLEKAQAVKQGMMQELLTGRIRLV